MQHICNCRCITSFRPILGNINYPFYFLNVFLTYEMGYIFLIHYETLKLIIYIYILIINLLISSSSSSSSSSVFFFQHASFGFSVDGRIISSFTRKCSNCSSPYCREVIYVKPGYQAELDSLVQDTIRLTTTVKDTCSESCEKSDPKIQYIGAQNTASVDKRWGRLLELRNAYL
ncbi:hypothetical protein Patl1_15853 [Pistacia atlantica]|uniref:Uncharacterized protein n=1 Tax=Pistacia atlantica TaxID=434234 RepID=A0ACC1BBG2_9ROSI|nr:hypothetical protein Patl1_15853 [Pistacia atlantica]